jgi:hypothetical protein
MQAQKENLPRATPEQLIHGLVKRLSHHILWDTLLFLLPPLIAALYFLGYLSSIAWLSPLSAVLLALATLGLVALVIVLCCRRKIPSMRLAARLIDQRVGAQDRFLTLATVQPSPKAAFLLSRLRVEAAGLQSRIAIEREFPYRVKRRACSSLLLSLAVVLMFHLLLPLAHSTLNPQPVHERLRELAQQMAARPSLREAARSLHTLAAKLEEPKATPEEKRNLAEQERKRIEDQEKNQPEKQDRELLSQAAGTLQGVEQQSGAGERKKDPQGGGGIQSNLPQQGQGKAKEGEGSAGDGKSELSQSNSEMQQGKMSSENQKEQGKEKHGGEKGGGGGKQPDAKESAKNQRNDQRGKVDGPGADRDGRGKMSEDIPQAAPPAERFNKPGEGGYQGIKGAGYVTVQLPEELAAEGKGSGQKRDAKSGKATVSQIPTSNVALPKHVPDAPSERQQMPLEYRGIIR